MCNYTNDLLDKDWRQQALCRGKRSDFWFPPLAGNRNAYVPFGRLVCQQCPVWEECLDSGKNEDFGIWGGLTARERDGFPHPHGTWLRYRQGCRCNDCHTSETGYKRPINVAALPDLDQELPPIEVIKVSIYDRSLTAPVMEL